MFQNIKKTSVINSRALPFSEPLASRSFVAADYKGLDGQCDVVCLMAVVNSTVYTIYRVFQNVVIKTGRSNNNKIHAQRNNYLIFV